MADTDRSESRALPDAIRILARARSAYNDIFVLNEGTRNALWFHRNGDFFLQSRVDLARPDAPLLVYSRLILAALLFQSRPRRVLCIGLGAGVIPRCLARMDPATEIDLVEIDPQVLRLARKYFQFRESSRCRVHIGDGRLFLRSGRGQRRYDIVFLDAFKGGSVPYHLKTSEFYRELADALTPDGVVVSNLYGKSNPLKPSDWKTFQEHFAEMYGFEDPGRVAMVAVAVARARGWGRAELIRAAANVTLPGEFGFRMEEIADGWMEAGLDAAAGRVFRDEFGSGDLERACATHNRFSLKHPPRYPIRPGE